MARFLRNGLHSIVRIVHKYGECVGPWIKDTLVEAARVLRYVVQELREFSQRVLADLVRRWRGETGF
jgi:hypothetical protein